MTGQIVHLGGAFLNFSGYDLLGVMTGSEGLLGVITEVTVRLLQKPETASHSSASSGAMRAQAQPLPREFRRARNGRELRQRGGMLAPLNN